MMRFFAAMLLALGLALPLASARAQETFSDAQKAAIESIIKEYLTEKNPKVVFEAAAEAQRAEQAEQMKVGQEAVGKNRDRLYKDPDAPVAGNPKGDVTIVEFFDYQCGYCKQVHETMNQLLQQDKNVRYIYKQFPVLGPQSHYIAKAALAAHKQGKFTEFHNAVMGSKTRFDEAGIEGVAKTIGLDLEKFKKDLDDPAIAKEIESNLALGQELGIRGTPGFVIADKVVPGARGLDEYKAIIAEARKTN